jgi:hypothetical protein
LETSRVGRQEQAVGLRKLFCEVLPFPSYAAGWLEISEYTAEERVNGHGPKNPAKKRQIMIDCMSLDVTEAKHEQ